MTTVKWIPVSRSRHATAGWLPYDSYQQVANQSRCPVLMAELPKINGFYPLAFHRQATAGYQLVAILGLQPDVNLYVNHKGQWLAPYVPSWYRCAPFHLLRNKTTHEQLLCVDETSPYFQARAENAAQRFFDDSGQPTQAMQQVIEFQESCYANRQFTRQQVQQLADAGLIQPWELQAANADNKLAKVRNLFRINEAALHQLPAETLATLAKSGALGMAYAQLLSTGRITDLQARHQLWLQAQAKANSTPDLEQLFEGDDDSLSFGF